MWFIFEVAFFEEADFSKWSISNPLFEITLFSRWTIFRKERFQNYPFFEIIDFYVTHFSKLLFFRSEQYPKIFSTWPIFRSDRFRGDSFFEVTLFLGHFLGHSLYYSHRLYYSKIRIQSLFETVLNRWWAACIVMIIGLGIFLVVVILDVP